MLDMSGLRFEKALGIQFFLLPASDVFGFAATMRSPACLAMEIMKSWISWRLRSAMMIRECGGFLREESEGL
jgi:hypothetical protein